MPRGSEGGSWGKRRDIEIRMGCQALKLSPSPHPDVQQGRRSAVPNQVQGSSSSQEHCQDPAKLPVIQEGTHDPNPASRQSAANNQPPRAHERMLAECPGWPGPPLLSFSCSRGHWSWPDPGLGLINRPLCWGRPGRLGAAVLGALG